MTTLTGQYPYQVLGVITGLVCVCLAYLSAVAIVPKEDQAYYADHSLGLPVTRGEPDTFSATYDTIGIHARRRLATAAPPLPHSIDLVEQPLSFTPPALSTTILPPLPPPPPPPSEVISCGSIYPGQMPAFPGCPHGLSQEEKKQCSDRRFLEYIFKNIKYPAQAREEGMASYVVIRFIIEKDGTVGTTEIIKGPEILGKAVIDALLELNKQNIRWQPGWQGGRPVRVSYHLPVRFCLR
ncbi:MAG: energy transducer TonB [Bacteroidota bacterium]